MVSLDSNGRQLCEPHVNKGFLHIVFDRHTTPGWVHTTTLYTHKSTTHKPYVRIIPTLAARNRLRYMTMVRENHFWHAMLITVHPMLNMTATV